MAAGGSKKGAGKGGKAKAKQEKYKAQQMMAESGRRANKREVREGKQGAKLAAGLSIRSRKSPGRVLAGRAAMAKANADAARSNGGLMKRVGNAFKDVVARAKAS